MLHQTIRRNADGSLTSIECPCGEDHGPSLSEELTIMRAANRQKAAEIAGLIGNLERVLALTEARKLDDGANRIKARKYVKATSDRLAQLADDLKLSAL